MRSQGSHGLVLLAAYKNHSGNLTHSEPPLTGDLNSKWGTRGQFPGVSPVPSKGDTAPHRTTKLTAVLQAHLSAATHSANGETEALSGGGSLASRSKGTGYRASSQHRENHRKSIPGPLKTNRLQAPGSLPVVGWDIIAAWGPYFVAPSTLPHFCHSYSSKPQFPQLSGPVLLGGAALAILTGKEDDKVFAPCVAIQWGDRQRLWSGGEPPSRTLCWSLPSGCRLLLQAPWKHLFS